MKTAALIAIAGLATVASAQPTASLILTNDDADNTVFVGDTVTWTLSVAFDGTPDGTAAGGNMQLLALDPTLVSSSDFTYTVTNGGNNGGTTNGAGIAFINWTNSLFISAFDPLKPHDPSNPFTVGTFTTTALAVGTLNYNMVLGEAASAFLAIGISAFADQPLGVSDVPQDFESLEIVLIPTPASAALLGLGGLVALRRRR